MLGKLVVGAFAALLLSAAEPGHADRFSVTPNGLNAGGSAEVSYSNPDLAGRTILVEVDDGSPFNTQYDYVTISLDANGEGTATWGVPESGWSHANFNAPEAREITLKILRTREVL